MVIVSDVQFREQQELVDSPDGDPRLHDGVDDPGEGVEGADQVADESHAREHLHHHQTNKHTLTADHLQDIRTTVLA